MGISSENAASQAKIILLLAVVWLIMALATRKHRKATIVIYAGISALFETFGLYSGWAAVCAFSRTKIMEYIIIAILIFLFLILVAVLMLKNQSDREFDDNLEKGRPYDTDPFNEETKS